MPCITKANKVQQIILSDNQDISRAGLIQIFSAAGSFHFIEADNKKELIACLESHPESLVVLDYTLFDIQSAEELLVLNAGFGKAGWLLFSNELSDEFVKQIYINSSNISILYKDSSRHELLMALHEIQKGRRYFSNIVSKSLLESAYKHQSEGTNAKLTATEKEILKDVASGRTTREISENRHVSVHTVVSHRKNIFRKIGVNNVHEATKYAVKAGLIDLADYFI